MLFCNTCTWLLEQYYRDQITIIQYTDLQYLAQRSGIVHNQQQKILPSSL